MSVADSTATSNRNARKNANKKLRKAKLKAAGGEGVPLDTRSPAVPAAPSSNRSCYHDQDDAASTSSWTLANAVPTSSSRATSVTSSAASSWDIISNADVMSDASARNRRKAAKTSVSSAVTEAAKAVTASAAALGSLSKPQGGDAYKFAADNNSEYTEYFAMVFTAIAFIAAFINLWRKRHYASFQACVDLADTMYI